jgi:hypothetical protein
VSIDHNLRHPDFCDPRVHRDLGPDDHDHRSAPLEWEVGADDVVVRVGLSQLEDLGPCGGRGTLRVNLELEHLQLARTVGVDLSSADARMLSAALMCAVEARDAAEHRGQVSR